MQKSIFQYKALVLYFVVLVGFVIYFTLSMRTVQAASTSCNPDNLGVGEQVQETAWPSDYKCSAGQPQKVPQGYALTGFGYASDDHICHLWMRTAPVNADGSVDFAGVDSQFVNVDRFLQKQGYAAHCGSVNDVAHIEGEQGYFFSEYRPGYVVTGWTWGAETDGGKPGDDDFSGDECYYQEYINLQTKQKSSWGAVNDGTCNEASYVESDLKNRPVFRAPVGSDGRPRVIVAMGMMIGDDAYLKHMKVFLRQAPLPPQVDIQVKNPATGSFQNEVVTIASGSNTFLKWDTANVDSCKLNGANVAVQMPVPGRDTGNLTSPQTYTLECTGPGGAKSDQVVVNIGAPPTFSLTVIPGLKQMLQGTSWDFTVVANCAAGLSTVKINSITYSGGASGLSHSYAPGYSDTVACGGSTVVRIAASSAAGPLSGDVPNQIVVNFAGVSGSATGSGRTVIELYGRPDLVLGVKPGASLKVGDQAVITWKPIRTQGAEKCFPSGAWSSLSPKKSIADGTEYQEFQTPFTTSGPRTYTLQCSGFLGTSITKSVSVTVDPIAAADGVIRIQTSGLPALSSVPIQYSLSGPTPIGPITKDLFPQSHSVKSGTYVLNIISVTPPSGYVMDTPFVSPGVSQTLAAVGTITYTLRFKAAPPGPSFVITATPITSTNILPGGSVTYRVSISCNSAVTVPISNFGYPGLASGVTPSGLTSIPCGSSQNLTISTPAGIAPGVKTFRVSGQANGVTKESPDLTFNVLTPPSVSLTANPTSVGLGGNSTLSWNAQNVDSCELFGDGRASLEVNAVYSGQRTGSDGVWTGTGATWNSYSGNPSLPGATPVHAWTKEVIVNGVKESVNFGVTGKTLPEFNVTHTKYSVGNNSGQHAWFKDGEAPYWTIDAGAAGANGYILWSLYKDGASGGELVTIGGYQEKEAYYGQQLDSAGHFEASGAAFSTQYVDPTGKVNKFTRRVTIVKDRSASKRNDPSNIIGVYNVSFTVSKYKPLLTMDRAVYTLGQSPVYTVSGAEPDVQIRWNSYFNDISMLGVMNAPSQAMSGSVSTGGLALPQVYEYRITCKSGTAAQVNAFATVRANAGAPTVYINYKVDNGAVQDSPAITTSFPIRNVSTGVTVATTNTIPGTFSTTPGQITADVGSATAPSGYVFSNPRVIPQNYPLTLTPAGRVAFTLNLNKQNTGSGGFTISVSPPLVDVGRGYTAVYSVDVTKIGSGIGELNAIVTSQLTGQPISTASPILFCITRPGLGTTCNAKPAIVDNAHRLAGGKVELLIPTSIAAAVGKYDVKVSIRDIVTSTVTNANPVVLQVNYGFAISVSPSLITQNAGQTATYVVDVTKIGSASGELSAQVYSKKNGAAMPLSAPMQFCVTRPGNGTVCNANPVIADNSHRLGGGKIELKVPAAVNAAAEDYEVLVRIRDVTINAYTAAAPVTLRLVPGPYRPVSLVIAPREATIKVGQTQPYTATATFSNGSATYSLNVTSTTIFSALQTSIATFSGATATGKAVGSTRIAASYTTGGVTVTDTTTPQPLLTVISAACPVLPGAISMTPGSLNAGDQASLNAPSGYTNVVFTLSSTSDPALATVSNGPGRIVGKQGGTVTVNATGTIGGAAGCSLRPLTVSIRDYSLNVTPNPNKLKRPGTSTVTVQIAPVNGGTMPVTISRPATLPAGWTVTPISRSGTPGDTVTFTVTMNNSATLGAQTLQFNGRYAGTVADRTMTRSAVITLENGTAAIVPVTLVVIPHVATIGLNQTQLYAARAVFSDGSAATVTETTLFTAKDSVIARFNNALATGRAVGTTEIVATYTSGGITVTDTTKPTLTVTGGGGGLRPQTLIITPHEATINVNQTQGYRAEVTYDNGSKAWVESSTVFGATNSSIATFAGSVATGRAVGTTPVTARYTENGITVTDTTNPRLTVSAGGGTPLPPLAPITVNNSACGAIEIQWTPDPASPPYTGYRIYRRNNSSDPWGSPIANINSTSTRFYTDSGISVGPLYYYGVTAYNSGNGLESAVSIPSPAAIAAANCVSDFSQSDKEVKDINGKTNVKADLSAFPNGKFDGVDPGLGIIKAGSTLTMVVRIYNSGAADVVNTYPTGNQLYILDTLQNADLLPDPPVLNTVTCRHYGPGPVFACRAQADLAATKGTSPNKTFKFYIRGRGLGPGQYYELTYQVKVPSNLSNQISPTLKNTVEVWYDPGNTGNHKKEVTLPFTPLPLSKQFYVPEKEEK